MRSVVYSRKYEECEHSECTTVYKYTSSSPSRALNAAHFSRARAQLFLCIVDSLVLFLITYHTYIRDNVCRVMEEQTDTHARMVECGPFIHTLWVCLSVYV